MKAMPKDTTTPCIFHVFDRRINFDSFPPNASFHFLLRSWVEDDLYRKMPPSYINLLDHTTTNPSVVVTAPPSRKNKNKHKNNQEKKIQRRSRRGRRHGETIRRNIIKKENDSRHYVPCLPKNMH